MKRPTLFLDRDGVINMDLRNLHALEDFEFVDGIFKIVVATNKVG